MRIAFHHDVTSRSCTKILKKGSPTCIKGTGDKIGILDGWIIYRLGDVVTSVLPLGRHTKDDKVLAVCSLNSDPVVSQAAELMYQGKMPSGTQLKENPVISQISST